MEETPLILPEDTDYGRTENYLILEDACKKITDWEITNDEYLSTLNSLENLIPDTESEEDETYIDEGEPGAETLISARKLYLEAIRTYREALLELREYLETRDMSHINDGLEIALEANRKLLKVQQMAEDKVKQLEETEKFFKQQQLFKRNMASQVFSGFSYCIQPPNKPMVQGVLANSRNKAEVFSVIPLFDLLSREQIEKISRRIKHRKCEKGTVLFNDKDNANEVYIIKSGEISLYKNLSDGNINEFAVVSTGDIFGEMGIISDSPRSLSACTLSEKTELYVISKDDFLYILKTYPEVNLELSRILCERITENHKRLLEYLS